MEARADARLGPAGDEELDRGDLVYIVRKHREKCRGRFLISALIQSINDNEGVDFCCLERSNNKFLHLGTEGLLSNIRACLQDWKQLLLELWIGRLLLSLKSHEQKKLAPSFPSAKHISANV